MASTLPTKKIRVRSVFRIDRTLVDFHACPVALADGPFNLVFNPDVAKIEANNNKRGKQEREHRTNNLIFQQLWLHHNCFHTWKLTSNTATMASTVSPFDLVFENNTYGFRHVNQNFRDEPSIFFDGSDMSDNKEYLDFAELGVSFDDLFMLEPDYV